MSKNDVENLKNFYLSFCKHNEIAEVDSCVEHMNIIIQNTITSLPKLIGVCELPSVDAKYCLNVPSALSIIRILYANLPPKMQRDTLYTQLLVYFTNLPLSGVFEQMMGKLKSMQDQIKHMSEWNKTYVVNEDVRKRLKRSRSEMESEDVMEKMVQELTEAKVRIALDAETIKKLQTELAEMRTHYIKKEEEFVRKITELEKQKKIVDEMDAENWSCFDTTDLFFGPQQLNGGNASGQQVQFGNSQLDTMNGSNALQQDESGALTLLAQCLDATNGNIMAQTNKSLIPNILTNNTGNTNVRRKAKS